MYIWVCDVPAFKFTVSVWGVKGGKLFPSCMTSVPVEGHRFSIFRESLFKRYGNRFSNVGNWFSDVGNSSRTGGISTPACTRVLNSSARHPLAAQVRSKKHQCHQEILKASKLQSNGSWK